MQKTAKFNLGDVVMHSKFGYRAVVVDIDPLFQASGRYNPQAVKHDFAVKNPWYRLLVDQSSQETYVEECYLVHDKSERLVDNPNIGQYLKMQKGHYCSRRGIH